MKHLWLNFCLSTFVLVLPLSVNSATLESSATEAAGSEAAIVTDQGTSGSSDAEEVAREILRLQEEMGGSIVTDFAPPERHSSKVPTYFPGPAPPSPPRPRAHSQPSWGPRQPTPVVALRETAWQLEQSAHLLESLDLYSQADALRTTATRLRQDARKMKSAKTQADSAAIEVE